MDFTRPGVSPQELPVVNGTVFDDLEASDTDKIRTFRGSLAQLAVWLSGITAPVKTRLPLIKLATFGNVTTAKGCYRNDGNVVAIYGVEIDYDGEQVAFEEACSRLEGVAAICYTSPSHTPDKPRWRVLLPFARERLPRERTGWVLRAGQILGIELGQDSLTLSQTYYAGKINDLFQIKLIQGEPIDLVHEPVYVPVRDRHVGERRPFHGGPITGYCEEALRAAARNIARAPKGQQNHTLNQEAFSIGTLVGAGELPEEFALEVLTIAAKSIPDYDPHNPWGDGAVHMVKDRFLQGTREPRDFSYGEPQCDDDGSPL
jgi:hypothetical protein